MGRKKGAKTNRDVNASLNDKDIYYGRLYEGMMKHGSFKKLSIGTRMFYVLCRVQAQSEEGRRCLYAHGKDECRKYNPDVEFVFPAKHLEEYGIRRQNATNYFRELEKAGFIMKVEQNNHRQKVNVYRFIHKWCTK